MKRSRFTEERIISILREQEAGAGTAEVCRKHGISAATFYKWKAKFGGLDVSDARRLKALEEENAKLKKLLAEAILDNAMLKQVASKNGDARRQARGGRSSVQDPSGERAAGVKSSAPIVVRCAIGAGGPRMRACERGSRNWQRYAAASA
jgi:putative transposase